MKPRPVAKHLSRKRELSIEEVFASKKVCQRIRVFKNKGVKCVHCGIAGTFFALEKHWKQNTSRPDSGWHLNLYADLKCGGIRLMTVDHIVPRSKGGSKRGMYNMQPMCSSCNGKKSNILPNGVKKLRKQANEHNIKLAEYRLLRAKSKYWSNLLSWRHWIRRLKWAWYNRKIPALPTRMHIAIIQQELKALRMK